MAGFRIAAAQVASVRGELDANIRTHSAAIASASEHGISVLVFPELSLTGYEPDAAAECALTATDDRLAPLTTLARRHCMTIVVGAPLRVAAEKPKLGAIIIAPDGQHRTYAKMHLGGSEPEFFSAGEEPLIVAHQEQAIGLAICADTSRPSHPQFYARNDCTIYAAGVFLNAEWYATDQPRLSAYAARLGMLVVMANHAASVGTHASVGKSAIWTPDGACLIEAAGTENCLVIATHTAEGWRGEIVEI